MLLDNAIVVAMSLLITHNKLSVSHEDDEVNTYLKSQVVSFD